MIKAVQVHSISACPVEADTLNVLALRHGCAVVTLHAGHARTWPDPLSEVPGIVAVRAGSYGAFVWASAWTSEDADLFGRGTARLPDAGLHVV